MSKELYLSRLALEIEKHEERGNVRKAQELHNYFLKVANIRDMDPEAFADDYREEQDLMPKLNEEYYGEYQENPDEDIADDSMASDMYDHDVNEFKNDSSSNAMNLINSLREELQHNDLALKILEILEEELVKLNNIPYVALWGVFLFYKRYMYTPFVIEKSATGERSYDIWSRLLKDRIVFLGTGVDDFVANSLIAQMMFLDKEDRNMPIEFYINSPGGSVSAGLAIYDVMHTISAPVNTTCIGLAASMGAVLLAGGTGERTALPHSRIMIHQVSSGFSGTAADINIQVAETNKLYKQLLEILSSHTKQTIKKLEKDCDRDCYMSAEEAKAYGLIDSVINSKKKV